MSSAYPSPYQPCPRCGTMMEAESVDIGVGILINEESWYCYHCDWTPADPWAPQLTMEEIPAMPLEQEHHPEPRSLLEAYILRIGSAQNWLTTRDLAQGFDA